MAKSLLVIIITRVIIITIIIIIIVIIIITINAVLSGSVLSGQIPKSRKLILLMAVFILQTYNVSGRLWARHFSASFCSSFNSSRIKTSEGHIICLDELNRLARNRLVRL